ncbi:NAD(P)-binding domain-containing protein [Deinococcus roseus]|uniref:FAD-dependent urate hydroxylase n=1 Tax=Deinococcus roseus TaxID=392414 RepID=A0ABQ2D0J5_9DEIO|nr:NAD(P)/FAD-dependent oxidoreductase [Deinococcus roseus]GGJ38968.1 FAD-dependent urate hydroxylase [Deinococcus roseus]
MTLFELEDRVKKDLELLRYPARDWIPETPDTLDVLIIGGGQAGLTIAFGLLRERVNRILVLDEHPEGQEGVWENFARMRTLRTPKHLTGPDLGIPSLTFQAYFEARFSEEEYRNMGKIPRPLWMEYLRWFRHMTGVPVENQSKVQKIIPLDQGFEVVYRTPEGIQSHRARRVVWATGMGGAGLWKNPEYAAALPRTHCAHTCEEIDFEHLAGKRVGVLGAGASAFDNAGSALEAGAKVDLYMRQKAFPNVNYYRFFEFTGFLKHTADLPDEQKLQWLKFLLAPQPPTEDNVSRTRNHPAFTLHPSCNWKSARFEEGQVVVDTDLGEERFDFVIFGTGFQVNPRVRPEFKLFREFILTWGDRYPLQGDVAEFYPYLGPDYAFQETQPGCCPPLKHLYDFTFGATASMGLSGASISSMKYAVPRLIDSITRSFYLEDAEHFLNRVKLYADEEVTWPV